MKSLKNDVLLKHLLLTILFGFLTQSTLLAQSQKFVLKNTEIVQLKNELTARDHELIIFLPDSYNDSIDKKYPVLYFLDGYWHMPLLYAIHKSLVYDNVIPELIMVGLSYPGENANYDSLRMLDLTPTKWEVMPNTGDAPKFLKFIEESVTPYVESHYRADTQQRALGGQSAGGLLSLYAMYEKPTLFNRIIAISPATWGEYLQRKNIDYSSTHKQLVERLFISASSDEPNWFRDPIITLQKQIEDNKYENLSLLNVIIEGERHAGGAAEGYNRGLRWIFKDITPPGPSGLVKAFTE